MKTTATNSLHIACSLKLTFCFFLIMMLSGICTRAQYDAIQADYQMAVYSDYGYTGDFEPVLIDDRDNPVKPISVLVSDDGLYYIVNKGDNSKNFEVFNLLDMNMEKRPVMTLEPSRSDVDLPLLPCRQCFQELCNRFTPVLVRQLNAIYLNELYQIVANETPCRTVENYFNGRLRNIKVITSDVRYCFNFDKEGYLGEIVKKGPHVEKERGVISARDLFAANNQTPYYTNQELASNF